jgi:phosphomannomutase
MSLFGTAGIRGAVAESVTPELALAVGQAVAADAESVAVGYDGRITSPALADAVAAGVQSGGASVRRVGEVPTPTLAFASRGAHGVMITASHNPAHDNGIKLFRDGSEFDSDAEAHISDRVSDNASQEAWDEWETARSVAVLDRYRAAVREYALAHGARPTDLTVAIDCGTGMAAHATPQVLDALGARVQTLEGHVDGTFPARESKPTGETLTALRSFVADGPADLGIGHDGDADRIVILDADGAVVHEDTILAILAEHFVQAANAADPVVITTPNASARIDERVRAQGGRVERIHLGGLHEGMARVDGDIVFAAEPWKHIHPDLGPWIDGVASAAVLTRLVADTGLAARREPVTERPYRKVSVDCPDAAKPPVMDQLAETLPDAYPEGTVSTEYGVRVELPDSSWVLVRPSGTEPYVRVYAESDDVQSLVEAVVEIVESAVDANR